MLRIVLKFDDVVPAIVAAHQVACAPPRIRRTCSTASLMGANAMQSEAGPQADCSAPVRVYYAAPFLNCTKMGHRAADDSSRGSTLHLKRGAQRKTGLGSTWS